MILFIMLFLFLLFSKPKVCQILANLLSASILSNPRQSLKILPSKKMVVHYIIFISWIPYILHNFYY